MTTSDRLKKGDRLRVVAKPEYRRGVRCHNRSRTEHDCYIMPGEIGVVTRTEYAAHDKSPMAAWSIEFDRGRRVALSVPEETTYYDATEACFLLENDGAPFRRVKGGH